VEALNPSVLRMDTPPDASFDLHLPAGTATLFDQRIAAIPEAKRDAWRYHHVAAEDTLASVAREHNISIAELAQANQLRLNDSLLGVEGLVVPQAPVAAPTHVALYTVRRGETLVTVADRFGVSLSQLRRWNGITGIRVEAGRRLHVAEPVTVSHASRSHRRAAGSGTTEKADATGPAKATTKSSAPHRAKPGNRAASTRRAQAQKPSRKRKSATKK
jgi:membrane-bound lytic murein transglycosylase D